MGDWYISCCGDIRNGLAGAGETDGIGDMGVPIANDGSAIKFGMAMREESTSTPTPNPRGPSFQLL
jgi:hypothetical protein